MNKTINCLLVALAISLTACRDEVEDLLQPGTLPGETLTSQFEQIWNGINQNYVFWEIDPVDWDVVYTQYKPKIEELDKQEVVKTADLMKLYEEAFGKLIDQHMVIKGVNVKAAPDDEQIWYVIPRLLAAANREGFHTSIPTIGFQVVRQKMQDNNRVTFAKEFVDDDPNASLSHMETCVIDNDILYLSFRSFNLIGTIQKYVDTEDESAKGVYDVYSEYMRQLLYNKNIKGVIVDVRSNTGGDLGDMMTVLSPLLKEDIHILDSKTKMGVGRLDYAEWIPWYGKAVTQRQMGELLDWEEELPNTDCIGDRKVVFLIDCQSISMAEMSTIGAKSLPYATVIGERSFGGLGPLTSDVHNSFCGQFGDINLTSKSYFVYTSTWITRTPAGECLEGKGVEPDISVPLDIEMITGQHIDNQLEYAIDYLHGKK